MPEYQPVSYEIFCLAFGEKVPFVVNIAENKTVSHLKKAIKSKKPDTLANINANNLTLYLINISADEELLKNVKERISTTPPPKALDPILKLSTVFKGTPAEEEIHILVKIPAIGK